jgi:hypothetical protein
MTTTNKERFEDYGNEFPPIELFSSLFDLKRETAEKELNQELKDKNIIQLFEKYAELRDDECEEYREGLFDPDDAYNQRLEADVKDSTAEYLKKKIIELLKEMMVTVEKDDKKDSIKIGEKIVFQL